MRRNETWGLAVTSGGARRVLSENLNERGSFGIGAAVAVVIVGLLIGWWLSPRANAHEPYGGCVEAWRYPHSQGAEHCRDEMWTIRKNFVLDPTGLVMFIDRPFRPCVTEDSDGPCYWVADRRGNRRGESFIIRGERDGEHRVFWVRF